MKREWMVQFWWLTKRMIQYSTFGADIDSSKPTKLYLTTDFGVEYQLSTFVDATQVETENKTPVADAVFLNKSWASLEAIGEEPNQNESVFSSTLTKKK